jgi:hypothetical protein
MRTKALMWMAASAMVLTLSQPASADTGRTVIDPFEFYSIGHGDLGGACLNDPEPTDPPETAAFQSCATAAPLSNEDHVGVNVVDSAGQAVYFSIQQDGNPESGYGCGTLTSHPNGFPLRGSGAVRVYPWAGPGINNVLDPGGSVCTGSVDTTIITPGEAGTVTFTFHDHSLSADSSVTRTFEFYTLGQGDIGGVCLNDPAPPIPPEAGAFQSCVAVPPPRDADHVSISVVDSRGHPVYFTVHQSGNPGSGWGCGTLSGGDLSADGHFPIVGSGPGGTPAEPIYVYPWAGPGINNVLDPGGSPCPGSLDPLLVLPGRVGTVTFTFHDHSL